MKIAAIYWPTSSVGGIETELRSLRAEADRRGDTFHVLRSGKQSTIKPEVFAQRKLIRGGDTFVTIDGEAPHHPAQLYDSQELLDGYDRIYLSTLCPHATKDYGNEPLFMDLLPTHIPIAARITDGYWTSYSHWGEDVLNQVEHATICQPGYAVEIPERFGVKPVNAPLDFLPTRGVNRSKRRSTVWTSQWKNIKGIGKFLEIVPELVGSVDMYSCGISYYQLRTSDDWKAAVRKDHFKGFNGNGKADYHGWVPLTDIPKILSQAWMMIDLQGVGKPRYKAYQNGSINLTTAEALYYGALPIVHSGILNCGVPHTLVRTVDEAGEVPDIVNRYRLDPKREQAAKAWAKKHYAVQNLYDRIIMGTGL